MKPTQFGWRIALVIASAGVLAAAVAVPSLGVVVERGSLRVSITAQLQPYRLPRDRKAPVDVFLAGHIASTDGTTPPQLQRMDIRLNRRGAIDTDGLPRCHQYQIAPASDRRALARCGGSLVGSGHFWASIVLPGQRAYHTSGRLLVFNGVRGGHPVLFAHIYTLVPFPTSFVVTFLIHRAAEGSFGTELSALLPQALGDWGYVDRIKMTVGRRFGYRGRVRGFVNAGCPAERNTQLGVFPLAVADFYFSGDQHLRAKIERSCQVRR